VVLVGGMQRCTLVLAWGCEELVEHSTMHSHDDVSSTCCDEMCVHGAYTVCAVQANVCECAAGVCCP
jgi:hypothetical protein